MPKGTCSAIENKERCATPIYAKGLCNKHYLRLRKHGTTSDPRPTLTQAFWSKVNRRGSDECWAWLGSHKDAGYGAFRGTQAHRVAYELSYGPIPNGLEIDHVKERGCILRSCCNPRHLEAVTRRENIRRSDNFAGLRARQTHCKRDHEFTPENTYINRRGNRECRACNRDRQHRYRVAQVLDELGLT